MRRIVLFSSLAAVALTMGACAQLDAELTKAQQVYTLATTTTVPADVVRPAANAFDILKGTAANFAKFCVQNNFTPSGCDVDTRRTISTFVKQGTTARRSVRSALATGQPVLSTVYNILIGAVNGLKSTPAATFSGG